MQAKIITLLALAIFVIFGLVGWSNSQAAQASDPRTITVTGDAEVRVIPDEVILTLGVETRHKDLAVAKQQNDERVENILNTITRFGVAPRHIQTDHISIEPIYDSYDRKNELVEYFARKTIVITLKDLSKFEDLLTAVIDAGANYVHGIQFRTTELRQYRDQARSLAIIAAQEKATAMAGDLNQTVGQPLSIQEGHVGWWSGYGGWWGGHSNMMMQNVIQEVGQSSFTDDTIAPGQITIQADVTVSFELK